MSAPTLNVFRTASQLVPSFVSPPPSSAVAPPPSQVVIIEEDPMVLPTTFQDNPIDSVENNRGIEDYGEEDSAEEEELIQDVY